MNTINSHHRQDNFNPTLDVIGERMAQHLLSRVDNIDTHTLQRLRAAREQAVEHRRMTLIHEAQMGLSTAGQGTSGQSHGTHRQPSRWYQLSGIGMLLALLIGLWMIDTIQSDNSTQDAAEVDRVLLTDDLPPAAYLDPGFKLFLKLSFPTESL
jgi:hypothetical protein